MNLLSYMAKGVLQMWIKLRILKREKGKHLRGDETTEAEEGERCGWEKERARFGDTMLLSFRMEEGVTD